MPLRLKVQTKELKNAVASGEAMSKKIPNDITPGDAFAAILRREGGFSWCVVHDHFTIEVSLPSMSEIGSCEEDICIPWDGTSSVAENNVLGIIGMSNFTTLLSKIGTVKELTLIVNEAKRRMKIEAEGGKEYQIEMSHPRKLLANYASWSQKSENTLVKFTSDQFAWFCSTMSTLGGIVKPSVTKPAFSNVVITAFPTQSKPLVVSGNSNDEGYSVVYESHILAERDFTSLVPKNVSEGFNSFLSKLGMPEGDVTMLGDVDEDNSVLKMFFSNDKFIVSMVCRKDIFPFQAIDGIVEMARKPYCSYKTKRDEIKKTVDRLAVFAKNDDAVSEINVLDGGSVEMIQKMNVTSKERPAREVCSDGVLTNFPEEIPSLGTSIKTNVIKSLVSSLPSDSEMELVVCEAQPNGSRRMALLSSDTCSQITAVLLGLRCDL